MNTGERRDDSSNSGPKPGAAMSSRTIVLSDNCLDSGVLFAGTREITITHGNEIYRLRLTAQNKLILTK